MQFEKQLLTPISVEVQHMMLLRNILVSQSSPQCPLTGLLALLGKYGCIQTLKPFIALILKQPFISCLSVQFNYQSVLSRAVSSFLAFPLSSPVQHRSILHGVRSLLTPSDFPRGHGGPLSNSRTSHNFTRPH